MSCKLTNEEVLHEVSGKNLRVIYCACALSNSHAPVCAVFEGGAPQLVFTVVVARSQELLRNGFSQDCNFGKK